MPRLYRDTHATFEDYVEQRCGTCHDRPGLPAHRRLAAGRAFVPHGGTNATNGRSANCSPLASRHSSLGHKRRTLASATDSADA